MFFYYQLAIFLCSFNAFCASPNFLSFDFCFLKVNIIFSRCFVVCMAYSFSVHFAFSAYLTNSAHSCLLLEFYRAYLNTFFLKMQLFFHIFVKTKHIRHLNDTLTQFFSNIFYFVSYLLDIFLVLLYYINATRCQFNLAFGGFFDCRYQQLLW